MKFKKIMSVFAGAIMLSSTVAFAAAANLYPKPFTDGAAIVYGTNADSSDLAGAIDIYDQLKDRVGGTTDANVAGEAKAVETASQALYLGDWLNNTKTTFTKDQLPMVLADDTITDDDGNEITLEQKITIPDARILYGDTSDNLAAPVIYLDTSTNRDSYALRMIFPTAVNISKLTDEKLKLFGKEYVVSGSASDLGSNAGTIKMVLFETATPVLINDGETVTAEGHTISVAVEDADTASITVDGITESKDEGWSGKIAGVDLYVKNVVGPNVAGTSRYAEVYLNSNKLTLDQGEEVKVGTTDIDGTNVSFYISSGKATEIRITTTPFDFDDAIKYVKLGDSFTDPSIGNIKFEMVSVTPELKADIRDNIVIKATGEKTIGIKFTNKAGKVYDMDIGRNSGIGVTALGGATQNSSASYNATELGVGSDYDLIVYPTGSSTLDTQGLLGYTNFGTEVLANESDYFTTCSGEYTQIWRLKNIKNSTPKLVVEDQGSGSSQVDVTLSSGSPGATGSLSLADGSSATLTLNASSATVSVSNACPWLYTQNGARINLHALSYNGTMNQGQSSNTTGADQISFIRIEEETAYNGGAFTESVTGTTVGNNLTVRFGYTAGRTGRDMQVVSYTPGGPGGTANHTYGNVWWNDDVGDYDNYYLSQYGTYAEFNGNTDKNLEIWYPENAMSLGFYIGEVSSEITPGSTGTAGGQIAIVKDTEVSTVASKHLVVIGGSCVNTVAAKILGSDAPLCGADFSASTNVGAGGYIIKTVASPENADKVAMLVAGYNAADTTNAIKRAMVIDGVTTDVDSEEIFPVVA